MGWSNDNGWTWTTNRIVNYIGAGLATCEPYLVVNQGYTHMMFRWGAGDKPTDGIGMISSPDSGRTWGPARKILDSATGRPTTIATSDGKLVMVYREKPSRNASVVVSHNNGMTWVPWGTLLMAPTDGGIGMTYATMVEMPTGIYIVCGMEKADGTSQLWDGMIIL
jgi:hypothetical protein